VGDRLDSQTGGSRRGILFWYKLEQPAIPTNPSELSEARRARRFIIESCLIEEKYFSQSERLVVDRNTCTQGLTA
jgi:hypothetical protein